MPSCSNCRRRATAEPRPPDNPSRPRPRAAAGHRLQCAVNRRRPRPTMSSAFGTETVLDVRHWTDAYFSFTTTRDDGFRFENGQFVMIGLEVDGKPLLRAYSIASANWEEQLEFFSITRQNGRPTSRLQHLKPAATAPTRRKPPG